MIHATISETKNQLSALLEKVRQGEAVLIYDRDKPFAKIVLAELSDDQQLRKLSAAGKISIATSVKKIHPQPVKIKESLLETLLTERSEGR